MLKPIIIVDGFDPSDGRKIDDCDCNRDPVCQEAHSDGSPRVYNPDKHTSFVELMDYTNQVDVKTNLITVLRTKGYDVIIVNQPTYTTDDGVTIDGGADFIERNGKAFVELLRQVNAKLKANGSAEKVVVMGPSMGGQITRYALAYMEKKEFEATTQQEKNRWKHNTRIWVAFDSPNLGANVPLGDQSLIKLLAEDSVEAQKSLIKLQSTAANEMLINYFKPITYNHPWYGLIDTNILNSNYSNGQTISQGMASTTGNPYLQEHYNNQFNNGLPNSNGFPLNLRKLAIVNGSLSGKTFGNGYEKILDVRLFKTICLINWTIGGWTPSSCFSSLLFSAESYSTPISNNVIARTEKLSAFSANKVKLFFAETNGIRGNLDNLPGGAIDATGLLHSAITGVPAPGPRSFWEYTTASVASFYYNHIGSTPDWETRTLKRNQCFIPTFSGLGIKNPNQSWANPLNRNLVCTNETYFDSYFGEAENTAHVSLNYNSVNWLMKELGDSTTPPSPQAPSFPLDQVVLNGPNNICENINTTYSFPDICKLPSAVTWSITPNAQIITPNNYSIVIKGITNGPATITATFQNGQTFTRTIWVGKPLFTFEYTDFEPQPVKSTLCAISEMPILTLAQQGVTNIVYANSNNVPISNWGGPFCIRGLNTFCVNATATNICGTTIETYECNFRIANVNNNFYKIYPNPSNNIVNVELKNLDRKPDESSTINAELYSMMGDVKRNISINNNIATIDIIGLPRGIYLLKINIDGIIESHQVAVE